MIELELTEKLHIWKRFWEGKKPTIKISEESRVLPVADLCVVFEWTKGPTNENPDKSLRISDLIQISFFL